MLIGHIIQRIQSLYSKGVQSRSSRLMPAHIYNKMLTSRNRLLYLKLNKRQKISQWDYSTIDCIELVEATINECSCSPPVGCKIMRTKYKLPEPITNIDRHYIQNVMSSGTTYFETTWHSFKYNSSGKYIKNKASYFIKDGYLFLNTSNGEKLISVTGLFKDPIEVDRVKSICNKSSKPNCKSYYDIEFPISEDLIDILIEMCVQELIGIFSGRQEDKNNNSVDEEATKPGE